MEVGTSNFRMLTQFVQGTDSHLMSYGPCVEHLEPGRDRGSRSDTVGNLLEPCMESCGKSDCPLHLSYYVEDSLKAVHMHSI